MSIPFSSIYSYFLSFSSIIVSKNEKGCKTALKLLKYQEFSNNKLFKKILLLQNLSLILDSSFLIINYIFKTLKNEVSSMRTEAEERSLLYS